MSVTCGVCLSCPGFTRLWKNIVKQLLRQKRTNKEIIQSIIHTLIFISLRQRVEFVEGFVWSCLNLKKEDIWNIHTWMKDSLLLEARFFPKILGHIQTQSKFQQTPGATLAKKMSENPTIQRCEVFEGPRLKAIPCPSNNTTWLAKPKEKDISCNQNDDANAATTRCQRSLSLSKPPSDVDLKRNSIFEKYVSIIRVWSHGFFTLQKGASSKSFGAGKCVRSWPCLNAAMLWICFVGVAAKVGDMGVSKNNGTPKSSILRRLSIINHPFWGPTPIFGDPYFWFSYHNEHV